MVRRSYYLLDEAFERLGQYLYGPESTNNELTAFRRESPKEIAAEIASLREGLTLQASKG